MVHALYALHKPPQGCFKLMRSGKSSGGVATRSAARAARREGQVGLLPVRHLLTRPTRERDTEKRFPVAQRNDSDKL